MSDDQPVRPPSRQPLRITDVELADAAPLPETKPHRRVIRLFGDDADGPAMRSRAPVPVAEVRVVERVVEKTSDAPRPSAWRFEVVRGPDNLITEIVATPTNEGTNGN